MRAVIRDAIVRRVRDPIELARTAFGLVFLLRTTPLLSPFDPAFLRGHPGWLGWPDGGWHVPVLGLALPAGVMIALIVLRTLGGLGLLLGVCPRLAGLTAGVAGYAVLAQDAFGYLHHLHMLYLGALLFGAADPAAPRSSLLLLRGFVASIYAWAAIGKLASEWGTGRALALFMQSGALDRSLVGDLLATPTRCAIVEITVVLVELSLPVLLLWPRTRRYALIAAFALHGVFEVVGRVDSIGWQMAALLLVFTGTEPRRPDTQSATARTSPA